MEHGVTARRPESATVAAAQGALSGPRRQSGPVTPEDWQKRNRRCAPFHPAAGRHLRPFGDALRENLSACLPASSGARRSARPELTSVCASDASCRHLAGQRPTRSPDVCPLSTGAEPGALPAQRATVSHCRRRQRAAKVRFDERERANSGWPCSVFPGVVACGWASTVNMCAVRMSHIFDRTLGRAKGERFPSAKARIVTSPSVGSSTWGKIPSL